MMEKKITEFVKHKIEKENFVETDAMMMYATATQKDTIRKCVRKRLLLVQHGTWRSIK